jgi:1,4-alpha-glucan branching enzyme
MAKAPVIDPHAARAIIEGRHGDPFSVLGLHPHGKGFGVTVFQPGAEAVWAVQGDALQKLDPLPRFAGLFCGAVKSDAPYRLRGAAGGSEWDWDDPYRFGPVLGRMDEYLLGEGTHRRLWKVLGARLITHEGVEGVAFAVWAPNAERVSVVGDFNAWDGRRHPMRRRGATGVREIFIPGLTEGAVYKYEIRAIGGEIMPLKADPVGFGS